MIDVDWGGRAISKSEKRVLLRQISTADQVAFCIEVYGSDDEVFVAHCSNLHEAILISSYEAFRLNVRIDQKLAKEYADAFDKLI